MRPHELWTKAHHKAAIREGWVLTNDRMDRVAIAKVDDPLDALGGRPASNTFSNDEDAMHWVCREAMESHSPLHSLAIFLLNSQWEDRMNCPPPKAMTVAPKKVYVDIPTMDCIDNDDGAWAAVATFSCKEDAVEFIREHFGPCDDDGNICLISG